MFDHSAGWRGLQPLNYPLLLLRASDRRARGFSPRRGPSLP